MLLMFLKMHHDSDDRIRLSTRSAHIFLAFEMTSARLLTFEEFRGFGNASYLGMMNDIRENAVVIPDAVVMRFVFRVTNEQDSHNYEDFVLSMTLPDSDRANLSSQIANLNISTSLREEMCADMSSFVELFKEKMQKHIETVLVLLLRVFNCVFQHLI